jgi:hypothetical protein
MLISPLSLPDAPAWRCESDYSLAVGVALRKAYALLARASNQESIWLNVSQILTANGATSVSERLFSDGDGACRPSPL